MMVNRVRTRANLLVLAGLWLALGACSFDPPPPVEVEGSDLGEGDMSAPADGMDGGDLGEPDLPAGQDMPADMPVEQDMPAGQDMPADMPTEQDMPVEQDMPAGQDMPADMPVEQDMPQTTGELGDPCAEDADCQAGRCEFFGGAGVCTISCASSCPDPGLLCVEGLCTPEGYCGPGDVGPGCDTCDKCAPSALCIEIAGPNDQKTYDCECDDGWTGDGYTCLDVDECQDGSATCDPNATCFNTPGDYECACNQGFIGDGQTCMPAPDVCDMCDVNASCLQVGNSQTCRCNPGWSGDGFTCQDLDECQIGTATCHPNATCTNTDGGYDCDCDSGYVGDGVNCQDVDECQAGAAMCDPLATCTNTDGGYDCDCPAGVSGDGFTCTLYGSCAEILQNEPNSASGDYQITTPAGPLQVYCDMTSDGGVGYTMVRFDDPALGATQQAYRDRCAMYGMEIVTPRSQQHMDAIIAWNGAPPNIVNVHPKAGGGVGLSGWEGICDGQPCSFFVGGRDNGRCRSLQGNLAPDGPGKWTDGTLARTCLDYMVTAASGANTGFYEVDVDGGGPLSPFLTFCEMTLDGGGWTLAVTSSDDGTDTWTWQNRALWTTDTSTVGSILSINRDYKNLALHALAYRDVLFWHSPSTLWAAYHDVGDGSGAFSSTLQAAPVPNCEPTSGYTMTAGTITAAGRLCNTDLYLHPGDYDGSQLRCQNLITVTRTDDSTFGPGWSASNNQSCPFDDPADVSMGPDFHDDTQENDGNGFAEALGLNVGAGGVGVNFLQLFLRGDAEIFPKGGGASTELLVREPAATSGPACTYGSWDGRGDAVLEQGWVICGKN